MAAPTFSANGTATDGAPGGDLTVVPPTHAADDLLLLWVATQAEAVSTPSGGWALVASSTNIPTGVVSLYLFSLIAPNSSVPNVTVTDPGNMGYAFITRIEDADPTDPIAAVATATATNGNTTGYIAGLLMPEADCLYVGGMAWSLDSAGPLASGETNADLTGLTERHDAGSTDGGGSGIILYTGNKATAGFVGFTTNTITSTTVASIALAIRPPASAITPTFTCAGTVEVNGVAVADGGTVEIWDKTDGVLETTTTITGGSGGFSVLVKYDDHDYRAVYDDGSSYGASPLDQAV